jgi:hypothetical protein
MAKGVLKIEGIQVVQAIDPRPGRPPTHLSRLLRFILVSPTNIGNWNRKLASISDLAADLKEAQERIATQDAIIEDMRGQLQRHENLIGYLRSRMPR